MRVYASNSIGLESELKNKSTNLVHWQKIVRDSNYWMVRYKKIHPKQEGSIDGSYTV